MRVVIAYFRSGGTLLNRCLGALPGVVIMSEVSPLKTSVSSGLVTVRQQAQEWYGIGLRSDDFLEGVKELHDICEATSRSLVLRLWVVGEFAKGRVHDPEPTFRLSAYRSLRDMYPQLRAVALVRDAIDIWLSRGCRPRGFFRNYLPYVQALKSEGIPIEKYERLCENPDASIERICKHLDLPFSTTYRRFFEFDNAKGDLAVGSSRAKGKRRIRKLSRRRVGREHIDFIDKSPEMVSANTALGYPTRYAGVRPESRLAIGLRWLNAAMGRYLDPAPMASNR